MRHYLSLYVDFVAQYWKTLMASKANLFLGLGAFLIGEISGILFLVFVFQSIPSLHGWTLPQLLFIYGFAQLPRGLDHLLTNYLWLFAGQTITRGEFDRYLLRPLSPLFQVIAEQFSGDALGELVVGALLIAYSLPLLGLEFSLAQLLFFPILVLAGTVIFTSIKLFFASLAFWVRDSFPLLNTAYMFSDFAKYPNEIYWRPVSWFLSFVLPFSFTAFIPASWLLGQESWEWAVGGTVLAAIASATVAGLTWRAGVKRYDGAGN